MFLSDVWLDPVALCRFGSFCKETQGGYEAGPVKKEKKADREAQMKQGLLLAAQAAWHPAAGEFLL